MKATHAVKDKLIADLRARIEHLETRVAIAPAPAPAAAKEKDCARCDGTGQYYDHGECMRCAGTGIDPGKERGRAEYALRRGGMLRSKPTRERAALDPQSPSMAELAKRYCAEHGVNVVDTATLRQYAMAH